MAKKKTFIKVTYGERDDRREALIGTGCTTDVHDVADYLDDIEAFREIGLGALSPIRFEPSHFARTVASSDPARFVKGEIAEAIRRLADEISRAPSASAELVG